MASQPNPSEGSGSFFGNSTTPLGQPKVMFSGLTNPVEKSEKSTTSIFSPSASQPRSLFGAPIEANRAPQGSLFGNAETRTGPSFFGASATVTDKAPQSLFGLPSKTPIRSRSQKSIFGRSSTPASPTPASRSSQSQTRNSWTSTPCTSSTPISQPSRPSSDTAATTPSYTPVSRSRSASKLEKREPPPKTCIDPNGDLCLDVGPFSAQFIVCSRTMARSSPFWSKMLYGQFAEGKKAQPRNEKSDWVVKLPEDNPAAMGIALNIIHGRFDQICGYEEFIYTTHFYNLCVLTDKYDMTHILRPWARGWSRSTHAQCEKLGQSLRLKFCHERLWIAWELGDRVTFEGMAKALLMNSSATVGNNLRYVGALEPPGIYESIEKARLSIIKLLLKPLKDIVQGLVKNDQTLCKENSKTGKDCQPLMLGNIIQSLHRHQLWPLPEALAVQHSVSNLATLLLLVEMESSACHRKCSQFHLAGLVKGVEIVMNSTPPLLTEAHKRHLEAQAKKSGFAPPEKVPMAQP
ncbi:hypothetical protein F5Y04DRAFT_246102 [Hypomontagnella monticulosa]|nr:hypothetical protein F5Y04DRAFT_246102 [Hypomontagnella monticulosa]